jgi:hypothetical protein
LFEVHLIDILYYNASNQMCHLTVNQNSISNRIIIMLQTCVYVMFVACLFLYASPMCVCRCVMLVACVCVFVCHANCMCVCVFVCHASCMCVCVCVCGSCQLHVCVCMCRACARHRKSCSKHVCVERVSRPASGLHY